MTTVVTIQQGGTSANSAAAALTALGAVNRAGDTMTGLLNVANATSIVTTGNVGFGIASPNTRLHVVGTTTIQEILEKANVTNTAMTANITLDILDAGAIAYFTANSSANSTLNIRGNSTINLNSVMANNQSITVAVGVTNNSSAFRIANVQIEAATVTPKWSGGSAPTASANSIDFYSFTILKTNVATYTVLGSKTQFA